MNASLKPLPSADCVAVLETRKPADKHKTEFFGTESDLRFYEAYVPQAPKQNPLQQEGGRSQRLFS